MEVITIFIATRFIFDDIPSDTYDLMIYDIKNKTGVDETELGGAWKIVESRIPSSPFPIVFGAAYDSPLQFTITFGSKKPFDRNLVHEMGVWLCKPGMYRWLEILQTDLEDIRYKCYMSNMKLITLENCPIAFTVDCECDCGYAHTYPRVIRRNITSSDTISIWNDSGYHGYLYPVISIQPDAASSSVSIRNLDDGDRETSFTGLNLSGKDVITIDNARQIITCTNGRNLYRNFNMKFLRLRRGENRLVISGKCGISIEYELLRIVGS